mgnify:CR=1 FL=1
MGLHTRVEGRAEAVRRLRVRYGMVDPATGEPRPLLARYGAWLDHANTFAVWSVVPYALAFSFLTIALNKALGFYHIDGKRSAAHLAALGHGDPGEAETREDGVPEPRRGLCVLAESKGRDAGCNRNEDGGQEFHGEVRRKTPCHSGVEKTGRRANHSAADVTSSCPPSAVFSSRLGREPRGSNTRLHCDAH